MNTEPNPEQLKAYLSESLAWAQIIGQVATGGFRSSQARRKEDGSLVTLMDERADRMFVEFIQQAFPSHVVLSEEQETRYDPQQEYTWVVDPIDGTTNFARGLPIWGISVALLWYGMPVVGVVDFPLLHETFSAAKGLGAHRNGEVIQSGSEKRAATQQLIMTCTRSPKRYRLQTTLKPRTLGSAAYHLVKVADGAALASLEATPKLWDIAAPFVILTEAGALLTSVDGSPVFPLPDRAIDYQTCSISCLTAASPELHSHLLSNLTLVSQELP